MKLLLTSAGVTNPSIERALAGLLGKPIAESRALFVPTGIYPFPGGLDNAWQAISGKRGDLAGLGWKSLGVLELSVLPSIEKEVWVNAVREADALLVWGGDPVFVAYWMKQSGLAELLPALPPEKVYVGVSAGAIATAARFGETYHDQPRAAGERGTAEDVVFTRADGEFTVPLVHAEGLGLVDFAIIPHVEFDDPFDAAIAAKWASLLPVPSYALDDQSAVAVVDGVAEVVSEGSWKLFTP